MEKNVIGDQQQVQQQQYPQQPPQYNEAYTDQTVYQYLHPITEQPSQQV